MFCRLKKFISSQADNVNLDLVLERITPLLISTQTVEVDISEI